MGSIYIFLLFYVKHISKKTEILRMPMVRAFTPLTKFLPFKNNWRVQMKGLHSWKQNTSLGGDTFEKYFIV